jgi:uncharacterized protein YciI
MLCEAMRGPSGPHPRFRSLIIRARLLRDSARARALGRSDMDAKTDMSPEELHARMLKKQLWVVMTKAVKPPEEVHKQLKAHLNYQIKIEKQGILYGAGPATPPDESRPAFGLIIIRAKDEAEARRIADADPMHSSGVRSYELYSWSLNEGRINVTLDFSDQTFQFV